MIIAHLFFDNYFTRWPAWSMLFHCLEVTTKWSGDASSVLGQKDPAPQSQRMFGLKMITGWWLNQPIWKIFVKLGSSSPNGNEHKTYSKPLPSLYIMKNNMTCCACDNYVFIFESQRFTSSILNLDVWVKYVNTKTWNDTVDGSEILHQLIW